MLLVVPEGNDIRIVFLDEGKSVLRVLAGQYCRVHIGEFGHHFPAVPFGLVRAVAFEFCHHVIAPDGDDELMPQFFCLTQKRPVAGVEEVKRPEGEDFFRASLCVGSGRHFFRQRWSKRRIVTGR